MKEEITSSELSPKKQEAVKMIVDSFIENGIDAAEASHVLMYVHALIMLDIGMPAARIQCDGVTIEAVNYNVMQAVQSH